MLYDSYITEKTESGLVNYFASSSLSESISHFYASNNSVADKESPCVIVECNSADEDFIGSGIYHVLTRLYFIYPHEDTGSLAAKNTAYNVFVERLYNNNENIISEITSSVSNLAIYDIFGKGISNSTQDNHWISEHMLEVIATYSA